MLELEFRAWDAIHKQWCEENVYIHTSGLLFGDEDYYELDAMEPKVCLIGVKVTLYTGLKDKNRKKIYEGDIIKMIGDSNTGHCRSYKGEVFCKSISEGMIIKCDTNNYMELGLKRYEYEIIGNIYENPELIK